MNRRAILLIPFYCLLQLFAGAQQQAGTLTFVPVLAGRQIVISDDPIPPADSLTVSIDELRFYVSGVRLLHGGRTAWEEPNSFHLMDASRPGPMTLSLQLPAGLAFDRISFQLGIDSATNVSGAMGGDLDPSNGMYWTWQSGYINVKLEGRAPQCPTRKHRFQFHLGGYMGTGSCLQEVSLPASGRDMTLLIDLNPFFAATDLTTEHEVMIPGPAAVSLAKRFAQCFKTVRP